MKSKLKLPQKPQDMAAMIFITAMALYYLWRMFILTPWYDELYTYYYFISRGPLYAAIHWPLPNNHVGYSVLSAILDLFGNPTIGLRGISWICSVLNLILLYRLCIKVFPGWLPFGCTCLYACSRLVNELSVQGRGYTLGTTCFLAALYLLTGICSADRSQVSGYHRLTAVVVLGLYTLPSSIYWVLPLYLMAGLYLLINGIRTRKMVREWRRNLYMQHLIQVVIQGVCAAVLTTMLYLLIWLAIGSNLMVKDPTSPVSGWSHGSAILHHPLACAMTGIRYMLATPYIQSVPREGYLPRLREYMVTLMAYDLPFAAYPLLIICVLGVLLMLAHCVMHFENSRTGFYVLTIGSLVMIPVMLFAQAKLPYYRVFSYASVLVAITVTAVLEHILSMSIRLVRRFRKLEPVELQQDDNVWRLRPSMIPALLILILFGVRAFSPDFTQQLGAREHQIYQIFSMADPTNAENPCTLDVDQTYLLKYGWKIDCQNHNIEGSDLVILDRTLMDPEAESPDRWKLENDLRNIPWSYLEGLNLTYENKDFILFTKAF